MLESVNRYDANVFVILDTGGSNCEGSGNGSSGLTKPATVIYYKNGVLTAAWPTSAHGKGPAMMDELVNVLGCTATIYYIQHAIPSTGYVLWNSTHAADVIATCASLGIKANVVIFDSGGLDSQGGAALINGGDAGMDAMHAKYRGPFGAGCGMYVPLVNVRPSLAPYTFAGGVPEGFSWGWWDQQNQWSLRRSRSVGQIDGRVPAYNTTVDGIHRDRAGMDAIGRQIARDIYNARLVR